MRKKEIVFHESKYFVYEDGTVTNSKGMKLKPLIRKTGYAEIGLHSCGKTKYVLIHRLVASAFCENPKGLKEVNHINGIKTDNRSVNLEWVSRGENLKHAYDNNLRKDDVSPKKIIARNIETGIEVIFPSIYAAAKKLHISKGNICLTCKGKRPYASGYFFQYVEA